MTGRGVEAAGTPARHRGGVPPPRRIVVLFGTRPEVIKLAPVVHALEARSDRFEVACVSSGQHADLVEPFAKALEVRVDRDLRVAQDGQSPTEVCQRALAGLSALFAERRPDAILVQGDTTTALAGALAGFYERIPVGHVEAGLRSGDRENPFPEEMNRRLISMLASFHFAPTRQNARQLASESVPEAAIAVTGNPVVDSVRWALEHTPPSERVRTVLDRARGGKLVVLTTHRRESLERLMVERLRALRRFVDRHEDVFLAFPVHPNPEVQERARAELGGAARVELLEPLDYPEFVHLMAGAWLVVSDSGGVQDEGPSLGKPILIIRENTERPEVIDVGIARLAETPAALESMLESSYADVSWFRRVEATRNPFGPGDSGPRIVEALARFLDRRGA